MQIYPREIGYRCKPDSSREFSGAIMPKIPAAISAINGKPKAFGA
jgi:hypothetical protein